MSAESPRFGAERVKLARMLRFNPIRSIDPESLARQLDRFQTGWLNEFALAADAIRRRDDVISGALSKREKSVSRRSWNILINEGLDRAQLAQAAEHQAALQFFFDHLTATHALDRNQRGGARLLFRQMMSAVAMKYAVHEIVWEPRVDPLSGKDRLTATFTHVPLWFFENTTGRLRFIESPYGAVEGAEMQEREWLVTVGEGIMEALSVCYVYKRLSLQDWIAFNEKFGTPGIHGKTSAAKGTDAWNTLVQAVESFSQDFACVTNDEAKIELVEAKGGASLPFAPLIERMDRAISAICRGADLSTMSAGTGEGTGASLQGDEMLLLEEDDAALITEALDTISRTVIEQLFGTDTPLAYLEILIPRPKSTDDTIKRIDTAVKYGVPVARDYLCQELDVPIAAEDTDEDDLLRAPAAPAQPSGAGPRLANTAEADVNARKYRAAALNALAQAQRSDFEPLIQRLEAINSLADGQLPVALEALRQDMPRIFRDVLARDNTAEAWEEILGAALVSGASEGREETAIANFDPGQPRDEKGRWTEDGGGSMSWVTAAGSKVALRGSVLTVESPQKAEAFELDDYTESGGLLKPRGAPIPFSTGDRDRINEALRRAKDYRAAAKASGRVAPDGKPLAVLTTEQVMDPEAKNAMRRLRIPAADVRNEAKDWIMPVSRETWEKEVVAERRRKRLDEAAILADRARAGKYATESYERSEQGRQMRKWNG